MSEQARSEKFVIEYLQVSGGIEMPSTATVCLRVDGEVKQNAACSNGTLLDAVFEAIKRIVGIEVEISSYTLRAGLSDPIDCMTINVKSAGREFTGIGFDPDIIVASAKALVNALNRIDAEVNPIS